MCGRYANTAAGPEVGRYFHVTELSEFARPPAWNIRPTDQVDVVVESRRDDGTTRRHLERARWSLLPPWAKDAKMRYATFNARSESAATTATFRGSVPARRAILPASGYYEWKTEGRLKRPFWIHPDQGMLGFAGLYSWWRPSPAVEWQLTATILTMDAVAGLAEIHPRTPVVLPERWWSDWLSPEVEGDQHLVDAAAAASREEAVPSLRFHEVAPLRGDGPELINPL